MVRFGGNGLLPDPGVSRFAGSPTRATPGSNGSFRPEMDQRNGLIRRSSRAYPALRSCVSWPNASPQLRVGVAEELDDESLFAFAELWLDHANDPVATVDRDPVARGERRVAVEVAGCERFVAALELVAVTERRH